MNILIDTQVFVWLIENDPRLGTVASQIITDTNNMVSISYFSFFEMTIKSSIGKLTYDSSIIDDLPAMGIELIMPDIDALRNYSVRDEANRDPFDNIIMSVAHCNKSTLMTSDSKILALSATYLHVIDATV